MTNRYERIGFLAGILTSMAYIPQVWKIWHSVPKPASDISLPTFSALSIGILLWLIYGVSTKKPSIIWANGAGLLSSALILTYKLIYG